MEISPFGKDFDNVSSTIKVRQAGFHDCIDSETMFSQFFQKLAEMKVLSTVSRKSDRAREMVTGLIV